MLITEGRRRDDQTAKAHGRETEEKKGCIMEPTSQGIDLQTILAIAQLIAIILGFARFHFKVVSGLRDLMTKISTTLSNHEVRIEENTKDIGVNSEDIKELYRTKVDKKTA
jgi:hypothetical protein